MLNKNSNSNTVTLFNISSQRYIFNQCRHKSCSITTNCKCYNLCSKCPPFSRTQDWSHVRHCLMAESMTDWWRSFHDSTMRSRNTSTSRMLCLYTVSCTVLYIL